MSRNVTKKFKNGWQIGAYRYDKFSIAVLPQLCISRYRYQGKTSIGCLKWNITFGWLIFGAFITNTYK